MSDKTEVERGGKVVDFRKKLEKFISYLPPIPVVLIELIEVLKQDEADMKSIGKIIEKDPSMSMNILKVANSALYSLPNKVTSIEHAVRLLGMREITLICISCGTAQVLKTPRRLPTIDLDQFWQHSVATGVIATLISKEFKLGSTMDLYLAGLMHDAGVIILDRFMQDVYQSVVSLSRKEGISVIDAEIRILGEDHGAVGGWLMEQWKLPRLFVEIASNHHAVMKSSKELMTPVAIISMADMIARLSGFDYIEGIESKQLNETDAYAILVGIDPRLGDIDIVKFVSDHETVYKEISEMKRIILGDLGDSD